jgi:large subunit ribosomal protein L24
MKTWSKAWKSSKKARKQRKYRFNAPLHIKRKFVASHLSKELRSKYKMRSIGIIKGDKVKVVRGQFKGHNGKIDRIDTKLCKIYISGIDVTRKDGSKAFFTIHPSNVIVTELNLEDKKRNMKLSTKK